MTVVRKQWHMLIAIGLLTFVCTAMPRPVSASPWDQFNRVNKMAHEQAQRAWNQRRIDAQRRGVPFNEPPPQQGVSFAGVATVAIIGFVAYCGYKWEMNRRKGAK